MSRPFLLLCILLYGAPAAHAQGPAPEERAFVELEAPRTICFVHEPLRVTLRIGFDAGYFRDHAVQMFQKRFDVPVQVHAPLPDGVLHEGTGERLSLVLNGAAVDAARGEDVVRDGRRYTLLEIERSYVPQRAGELMIAAPELRFQYATEFKEDFLGGRLPVDPRDALVKGAPLAILVRALPEEGKPPEFTGAVGRFTVRADARPLELEAGSSLTLVLRIEGEGNLASVEPPMLDGLKGFHVYGMLDDGGAPLRTITYELAPLDAAAEEVPAIPFAYFDPGTASYRTVYTQAIPLTVRCGKSARADPPPPEDSSGGWFLLVAAALTAFGLLLWVRSRRQAPAPDAAAAFRTRAGDPDVDLADALAEYLAARLGCAAASVIAPDLPARLEAAGVPADLAARTAALLERLVAARYGGSAADPGAVAEACELAGALESSFAIVSSRP